MNNHNVSDAFFEELLLLAGEKENIVLLNCDQDKKTKVDKFAGRFPSRYFPFGASEDDMISSAAGMAVSCLSPVAIGNAMLIASKANEQIRNNICYPKLNVKIVGIDAGFSTISGSPISHSLEDIAILRSIPNINIISPADCFEARNIVKELPNIDEPVYIRLNNVQDISIFDEDYNFKLGKASLLREGKDISLLAYGSTAAMSLEAAEQLAKENISAEVINLSTIKPLDIDCIKNSISKTQRVVTIEEHSIIGGLGSAIAEFILESQIRSQFYRIGIKNIFVEPGTREELLTKYGFTVENICKSIEIMIH